MKGKRGGTSMLIFHLLAASVFAGGRGSLEESDLLHVPAVSDDHLNFFGDSSNPSSLGESLFYDGVLWNLSPEGDTSSSSSPSSSSQSNQVMMPPKVICTKEGIFPVAGSCHDYYYCQDLATKGLGDWNVFWFTCQEGNVFDVDSQKCLHHSLITGRSECQQEKQELKRRMVDFDDDVLKPEDLNEQEIGTNTHFNGEFPVSRAIPEQDLDDVAGIEFSRQIQISNRKRRSVATENMVDIIAQSARETCVDVKNIDNYIKQISSKGSLEIPSNIDEVYTNVLKRYNDNLNTAKHNTDQWKKKNGVLAAIKETYFLTEEFEPKFSERFQRMKKRVATVLQMDAHKSKELEEELNSTKNMMTKTEEALQVSVNMKVNEFILQHLQEMLATQKEDHRRLIKEYNEARKEAEFEELTEILEYVKINSIEIQEKVEDTRIKMENFQAKIQIDSGNFNSVHGIARKQKQLLQKDRDQNRKKISEANTKRANLRRNIDTERNRINVLNRQLQSSKEDLRQQKQSLERAEKKAKKKRIAGGILMFFNPIIGGVLLGTGIVEGKAAVRQKEAVVKNHETNKRNHERQVSMLNNEIQSANNQIAHLEAESQTLQREMPILQRVDDGLENLQVGANSLLPFLSKAISSLERMKEVFLKTEQDLDSVIRQAGNAHTSAQKRLVTYFQYHEVDKIKKNWEKAREKIISVGECVTTK